MTGYNLQQYDRGPDPLSALVGGLIGGAKAGYGAARTIRNDRNADEDRERGKLIDAIKLRIELENAGYNPDDLTPGESPPQDGGTGGLVPRSPGPSHPGHRPMDEDPRDFGMEGFGAIDPGFGRPVEGRSIDPGFGRPVEGRSIDPGFERRSQGPSINGLPGALQSQGPTGPTGQGPGERSDPRKRVADLLFGAAPRLRKTGESAAERTARLNDDRITARQSAQSAAEMERERYQQGEQNTRQTSQLGAQERMNDADNAARLAEERLRRATSLEVAGIRGPSSGGGGLSADPNVRRVQMAINAQKGIVDGLDRAIAQVQKQVPATRMPGVSEQDWQRQYGQYIAAADSLRRRRDVEDAKRVGMVTQLMSGSTDFSGVAAGAQGPPSPQGQMAGMTFQMDQERINAQRAAERIMALGLDPAEQQRRLEEVTRRYNARVAQPPR